MHQCKIFNWNIKKSFYSILFLIPTKSFASRTDNTVGCPVLAFDTWKVYHCDEISCIEGDEKWWPWLRVMDRQGC